MKKRFSTEGSEQISQRRKRKREAANHTPEVSESSAK